MASLSLVPSLAPLGAPKREVYDVSDKRFAQKCASACLSFKEPIKWDHARIVTPGSLCGYQTDKALRLIAFDKESGVKLFTTATDSQGLALQNEQVVAASVSTAIKTTTARKKESKGTFVQYDKDRVEQTGADFVVSAKNYKGKVNYQGGHLIDHKYSAGGSHYFAKNYIPIHFCYNAPLKEYLVQQCDAYVEVPLYTSKPPKIGVKNKRKEGVYHQIPVGIVFVQIKNKKIRDIYYFPNAFDYKGLKDKLQLKHKTAETIAPYFKLRECFHPLLRAAMIVEKAGGEGAEQIHGEVQFFDNLEKLAFGMSLAESREDQEVISQMSFKVLNKEKIDPRLYLACSESQAAQLQGSSLELAFSTLGEFLVTYGLKNALKSEVIGIGSRLVFVNVVIDFLEAKSQVTDSAWEFIEGMNSQFKSALKELDSIAHVMDFPERLYLADTYKRLCSPFLQFVVDQTDMYDFDDMEVYFRKFVGMLKMIMSKDQDSFDDEEEELNILHLFVAAQEVLDYLLRGFCDKEDLEKEAAFLKSQRDTCLKLLEEQDSMDGQTLEFQANLNRTQVLKTGATYTQDYLRPILENLGANSSKAKPPFRKEAL